MGLKFVEPIKSAVLILLILISITLTFSIWTSRSNYQPIESATKADVKIADKQTLSQVIRPYKILAISDDGLSGTTDKEDIESLMDFMKTWSFQNLAEADKEVTADEADEIISQPDSVTLFFRSPIPFGVVDSLFRFGDSVTTESSFSQMVIETQSDIGRVHFIGQDGGRRFTAHATNVDPERLNSLLEGSEEFEPYAAIGRETARTLFVPSTSRTVSYMTFFQREVSPSEFIKALFPDKNNVQRIPTGEHSHSERYHDINWQLNVNTEMKTLRFRDMKGDSNDGVSIPSELLVDSLDYVNEHSGWTNDFVLSSMDPLRKQIKYRMEVRGYPVFSDSDLTLTEITQIWGNSRISSYSRPYYQLNEPLPENTDKRLPAGTDVVEELRANPEVEFSEVDDIVRGYELKQTQRNGETLYALEPAWFFEESGEWRSVKKAGTGGGMGGLE
ncbi:Two-component system yycF/yycG regulatory protein yycH [Bhargavaea cecembensis DSE10]|uniref:Two-component system yycF/yycG regulatory protein yycH n=1 Tax=Bhargavaea cecembensis DSE10 TaxID=1235279 RepID=M7NAB7_9BACL|nr:two-component system activity regulator YycH [Bhargavaea cecembensis]EMR05538.1 Two-component system yycF/yycG regulatory protein yycH [Bhargavaea cecembensis DSE10]